MSNSEDDGLISQEDIDKLLGDSSMDETPEVPSDDLADVDGELSQDDIDALLGNSDDDGEDAGDDGSADLAAEILDGDEDDLDLISQDDIDALLAEAGDDEPALEESAPEETSLEPEPTAEAPVVDSVNEDDADDDDEMISMEDIQGMLSKKDSDQAPAADSPEPETPAEAVESEAEAEPEPEPAEELAEAAEEIPEAPADDEFDTDFLDAEEAEESPAVPVADDFLITGDEAVAAEDCLVDQETLDTLMADYSSRMDDPPAEEDGAADISEDEFDLDDDALGDVSTDELDVISLDEADFTDAEDEDALDPGSVELPEEKEVTQEDIDALLMETDDGDEPLEDEGDILISQEDIDTLLMAADQEDEDVLGDLMGDIEDTGPEEDDLDDDFLFDEGEETEAEAEPEAETPLDLDEDGEETEDVADPIILDESEEGEAEETPAPAARRRFTSRLILAAVTVLLVVGISVPVAYFMFFSGGDEAAPTPEAPIANTAPTPAVQPQTIAVTVDPEPVVSEAGTLILPDFVILTAEQSREMTFVTTDVTIDYSSQRAYHEISNNMSYYRGLVYEAIQDKLTGDKGNEVTEADLLWEIELALKRSLPAQDIDKISFQSFKTR